MVLLGLIDAIGKMIVLVLQNQVSSSCTGLVAKGLDVPCILIIFLNDFFLFAGKKNLIRDLCAQHDLICLLVMLNSLIH